MNDFNIGDLVWVYECDFSSNPATCGRSLAAISKVRQNACQVYPVLQPRNNNEKLCWKHIKQLEKARYTDINLLLIPKHKNRNSPNELAYYRKYGIKTLVAIEYFFGKDLYEVYNLYDYLVTKHKSLYFTSGLRLENLSPEEEIYEEIKQRQYEEINQKNEKEKHPENPYNEKPPVVHLSELKDEVIDKFRIGDIACYTRNGEQSIVLIMDKFKKFDLTQMYKFTPLFGDHKERYVAYWYDLKIPTSQIFSKLVAYFSHKFVK